MGIIQRQGFFNTLITYAGIVIGFLNLIVLQPYFLTPEEIGLTRVLFSFASLVAMFIPMGVVSITIRYFPVFREKERGHYGFFGFMLLFPLAGAVITGSVLWLLEDFFVAQYSEHSALFAGYFHWVIPFSFILGLVSVLNVYASALFRTTVPGFLNEVFTRLLMILLISVYFLKLISLDAFVFCFVSIYALQLIGLMIYIGRIDSLKLRPDKEHFGKQNIRSILVYGFLLSFASFSAYGLKMLDSILIGKFMALGFVGIYTIAAFTATVIEAPLNSLERITGAKMSDSLSAGRMDEVQLIYYRSSRYLFLLGGFLFLGVNTNVNDLLNLLPPAYAQGSAVVFIMSLGALANMAGGSNGSLIFSTERYVAGAVMLIVLALLALLLNLLLIPLLGMEGAALSTAIASITYTLLRFVFIWRVVGLQPYDGKSLKILLLVVVGFLIGYYVPMPDDPFVAIPVRSALVLGFYATGVYSLKIVPELHKFVSFIKKRNL